MMADHTGSPIGWCADAMRKPCFRQRVELKYASGHRRYKCQSVNVGLENFRRTELNKQINISCTKFIECFRNAEKNSTSFC
jgi:hypothetical protein